MAGRRMSTKGSAADVKKAAKEAQELKDAATAKKGEQSAMLGHLACTAKPGAKELLERYKSLDRFSDEKTAILEKFKMDKSLAWANSYLHEKKETKSAETSAAEGYLTKCPPV